ncbi:glycosyltransferase family 4 protein [Pseudomonas sp. MBLB4136]|uniref:glycosyltransferase family 4 protein n=1 Tax=Pseudomonas sp. MBLB4136 TaxID=3451558 RepID=UPI003F751517
MKDVKTKILLVLSRSLSSSDGGREALIIDFIKRMSVYCDISAAVFNTKAEVEQDIIISHKNNGVSTTIVLAKPGLPSMIKNVAMSRGAFQEALFFSKYNLRKIEAFVKCEGISAVYFDMVRLFKYAEGVKNNTAAKVVYDLDDLLSLRYDLFARSNLTPVQVFGSYGKFIPIILSKVLVKKILPVILSYEAKKCREREIAVASIADVVLITSPSEKEIYQKFTGRQESIFTNFPIVNVREAIVGPGKVGEKELVWLGNNYVAHNIEALEHLISSVLPKATGFTLVVAGKTPAEFVERHRGKDYVQFVGFISCVDVLFRPGKILISPFKFGTGIKIKLLEAMSSGVAVVTNDIGFQGIPHGGNVYFTPCSSDEEIIDRVHKLTSDHSYLYGWLVEQRKVLERHFSRSYEKNIVLAIKSS